MIGSHTSKPPSVSRRCFLRLMATAAAGASLTACAPRRPAAAPWPSPSGKAQLVYRDSSAAWFAPMVVELLEQFHTAHPNIHVYYNAEPAVQPDIERTTMTQMESGTAADFIQGCCTWFPLWPQRKHLVDLRPTSRPTSTAQPLPTGTRRSTARSLTKTAHSLACRSIAARWPSIITRTFSTSTA